MALSGQRAGRRKFGGGECLHRARALKNNDTDADYLTLVLNSLPTQMQAEWDSDGAIIEHWRPEQIEKILIPILPPAKRKQLADKVRESFENRRQSESLLIIAKTAVEIAIEKGEKAALRYLEENNKK